MPGIIVSRPIFNTLFKLAHEEGLSINAFLTKLLEKAGPDALTQAVTGGSEGAGSSADPVTNESAAPMAAGVEIAGTEQVAAHVGSAQAARVGQSEAVRAEERAAAGTGFDSPGRDSGDVSRPADAAAGSATDGQGRGRRIGNSIWDKVVSMEGHRFATSRGKRFSYKVTGEYIVVRDSSARIPRSQFAKAEKMWPVSGPSRLVGVYAPSVVWAVMKEAAEAEAAEPEAALA
jgi:hypothetical protein